LSQVTVAEIDHLATRLAQPLGEVSFELKPAVVCRDADELELLLAVVDDLAPAGRRLEAPGVVSIAALHGSSSTFNHTEGGSVLQGRPALAEHERRRISASAANSLRSDRRTFVDRDAAVELPACCFVPRRV